MISTGVESCDEVQVESSYLQPDFAGTYNYTGDQNGRVSFEHSTCPIYLYYLDTPSPLQFWLFGPTNGGPRGFIMAFSTAESPVNATEWLAYDSSVSGWVADATIAVACVTETTTAAATCELHKIVMVVFVKLVIGVYMNLCDIHNSYKRRCPLIILKSIR